jgi:hypothetical protein
VKSSRAAPLRKFSGGPILIFFAGPFSCPFSCSIRRSRFVRPTAPRPGWGDVEDEPEAVAVGAGGFERLAFDIEIKVTDSMSMEAVSDWVIPERMPRTDTKVPLAGVLKFPKRPVGGTWTPTVKTLLERLYHYIVVNSIRYCLILLTKRSYVATETTHSRPAANSIGPTAQTVAGWSATSDACSDEMTLRKKLASTSPSESPGMYLRSPDNIMTLPISGGPSGV